MWSRRDLELAAATDEDPEEDVDETIFLEEDAELLYFLGEVSSEKAERRSRGTREWHA
jgi:hypothetical protein